MIYRNSYSGLTLVELLVVIAVAGVLIGLATPGFNKQIANNRSVAQADDLIAAISLARAEAIKRAGRVSICASEDGETCGGEWTDGYMIFYDYAARDDAANPSLDNSDGDSRIVKFSGKQDVNAELSVTRNGAGVSFFRFTSLGTLAQIDNFPVIIDSKIQSCSNKSARKITIPTSGMVRVESVDC